MVETDEALSQLRLTSSCDGVVSGSRNVVKFYFGRSASLEGGVDIN